MEAWCLLPGLSLPPNLVSSYWGPEEWYLIPSLNMPRNLVLPNWGTVSNTVSYMGGSEHTFCAC